MERKQTVKDSDQFYNLRLLLGEKLRMIEEKSIVIVGSGTIGSNMALALAGNAFRDYIFIDGDTVSKRNIPLCDAFTLEDLGKYKVEVLKDFLKRKYGRRMNIETYHLYVNDVPLEKITEPDMLILAVDNNLTKLFVTYQRMKANKPMVVIGFWGWEASYLLTIPGKTACWACLFRPNNKDEVERLKEAHRCPEPEPNIPGAVIEGTVRQITGLASNEITKFFLKESRIVQYYSINVKTRQEITRFLDSNYLKPDPSCPICKKEEFIDVSKLKV